MPAGITPIGAFQSFRNPKVRSRFCEVLSERRVSNCPPRRPLSL